MDRRVIIYVLTMLLCASTVWGRMGVLTLAGTPQAVSFACSSTPYASSPTSTTSNVQIADTDARYHEGLVVTSGQASHSLCQVDFYIRAIAGDVSGKSYTAKVYDRSGTTLIAPPKAVSSAVPGASISAGTWVPVSFTTPVTVDANDVVVFSPASEASDPTNYISMGYGSTDADSGYSNHVRYALSGALTTEYTDRDVGYRLYEVQ